MKNPSRRDACLTAAATSAEPPSVPKLEDAPMSDIIGALAGGQVTATALIQGYLARIAAYDRDGPMLNAVRELNPDAFTIAGELDDIKPSATRPLAGIPILVKDNIATGDKQPTTAGSLALAGARAKGDATVVKLLRNAGAVILGKANLTEFANMLAIDMPSGYSSLGGQVSMISCASLPSAMAPFRLEEPLRADAY
jgi:amidase